MKKIFIASCFGLAAFACSDSSDPDTVNPEDLSPPSELQTVTGDGAIELRWQGVNFEDDFKGYHVFVTEADQTLTNVQANAKYPSGVDISTSHVPYCADNAALFKMFGVASELCCNRKTQ